jgi:hypothetical protein
MLLEQHSVSEKEKGKTSPSRVMNITQPQLHLVVLRHQRTFSMVLTFQ